MKRSAHSSTRTNSAGSPTRIGVAVALAAAVFAIVLVPMAAQAQPTSCNGIAITVDLALGQTATDGDDVIAGTSGPDVIAAGAGNDLVCGFGGDDVIWGQAGDDTILGGDGADRLRGGAGDDSVLGEDGPDDLSGGTGDDNVRGGDGDDTLVRGGTGDDLVFGDDGDDALVAGNGGSDEVHGGAGDDKVTGGPRPDMVRGNAGNDELRGNKGADNLAGGSGDDQLWGGPQPDLLDGSFGVDDCNGGTTGDGAVEADEAYNCETMTGIEIAAPTAIPTPTNVPTPINVPTSTPVPTPVIPTPTPIPTPVIPTPTPIPTPVIPTPTPIPTPTAPTPAGTPPPALPASSEASDGFASDAGAIDSGPPIGPPIGGPPPQAGLLTAADIDDNLNFQFFTEYLSREQQSASPGLPNVNLTDRLAIRMVDGSGNALSNAMVEIAAADGPFVAHANAEGILYLFPGYSGLEPAPIYSATITDSASGQVALHNLDPASFSGDTATDLVAIPTSPNVERRQAMDVAFIIDATGSMGDEIAYLKAEFASIISGVEATNPNVDLRFALIVYRDIGDEYVTRTFDFDTAESMLASLEQQSAAGGGDRPEAMEAALQIAAEGLTWRGGDVSRVAILNADAPPHSENFDAALTAVEDLRESGVRLYPLAASGVADTAEYLMRIMAATTGGRHLFITDDSGIGGAHQEPVVPCFVVTRLDQLLKRVLETELAGERVEPSDNEIIRTVGDYDNGACGDVPLPPPTPTPTPAPGPLPKPSPIPLPPGFLLPPPFPTPTASPTVSPIVPIPTPPPTPVIPPAVPIGSANLSGPFNPQAYAQIESFSVAESYPEQITVTFWGGIADCMGATATASATDEIVYLSVRVGGRTDVGDIACIALAVEHRLTIALTEGLDGREIVLLPIPVPA